jgi:hypothetical protein
MALTEFLLARIALDEAPARAALDMGRPLSPARMRVSPLSSCAHG